MPNSDGSTRVRMTLLHRCKFVDWMPQAINAMDMSPSGTRPLLAVSRTAGDLELYDASQNWLSRRIPSGRPVECLLWLRPTGVRNRKFVQCERHAAWTLTQTTVIPQEERLPAGRLVTAGHDGSVVEWDVERGRPRRMAEPGGGGVWAMAASPDETHLALACADGNVRIIDSKAFEVVRVLPGTDGSAKLLSVAWSKMNPALVAAGTSDSTIIVWNVTSTGAQLVHRINMEAIFCTPTMVWCVRFAGKTLVSGNSLGQVQFWNPRLGTHMTTCKLHKVDVLTIAVHPSQRHIFTCGADGKTLEFKVGGSDRMAWRPCGRRTDHSHDIRAAIVARVPCVFDRDGKTKIHRHGILITGGMDTKIVMYDPFGKKKHETRVISSLPKRPVIRLAKEARVLAASVDNCIKIWTLGTIDQYVFDQVKNVPETEYPHRKTKFMLSKPGRYFLQMNIPGEETVNSFDITTKADRLVYTTRSTIRLYNLKIVDNDLDVKRLTIPETDFGVPQVAMFNNDSLLVAYLDENQSTLVSYAIDAAVVTVKHVVPLATGSAAVAVDMMSVQGNFVAIHNLQNVVYVVNRDKLIIKHTTLPSFVQAMRVLPSTIVLITADRGIHQLILPSGDLASVTELPAQWTASPDHIVGMAMVPNTRKNFRIWTESQIIQIDLDKPLVATVRSKKTKKLEMSLDDNIVGNFERFSGYKNIMLVDYLTADEAIIVERPWEAIANHLPEAQDCKKFGGF